MHKPPENFCMFRHKSLYIWSNTLVMVSSFRQRWQSIPSRSIWLGIGSRLIELSKGLGLKYRASNQTELKLLEHRTEPSQPSYTIELSRTFNLNARCSVKRLDLARSF